MRFHRLRSRPVTVALAASAALVVAGGTATAALPGPDGTIAACYDNSGKVRVLDPAQDPKSCGNNETSLNWNQTGRAHADRRSSQRCGVPAGTPAGRPRLRPGLSARA